MLEQKEAHFANIAQLFKLKSEVHYRYVLKFIIVISVSRLGDFLHFGQPFKALGNHLKPVATIILPKLPTLLGNFCKSVKIYHFSSKISFGQFL